MKKHMFKYRLKMSSLFIFFKIMSLQFLCSGSFNKRSQHHLLQTPCHSDQASNQHTRAYGGSTPHGRKILTPPWTRFGGTLKVFQKDLKHFFKIFWPYTILLKKIVILIKKTKNFSASGRFCPIFYLQILLNLLTNY